MADVTSTIANPPSPPPTPLAAATSATSTLQLPMALQQPPPAATNPSQVQAAISFLTNPKVQSSPPSRKFSFLESKGLTSHEILEALQRTNSGGREYQLLSSALQGGDQRKASEIVASLDSETPTSSSSSTTPAPTPSYAQPSSASTYSYQAPQQQQQPVLYAIQQPNGQVLYSTTPPPVQANNSGGSSWLATTAAVGAIAGTGALANYLYQKYMPTIRIESRHHQHHPAVSDATHQQQNAAVHQLMAGSSSGTAATASKMNGVSEGDKYGLTTLTSNASNNAANDDDQTYRAVTGLKSDMRDVVDLLREQTTDIKRALNTIQLSLEVVSRRSREKDSNAAELNETLTGIKQLLQRSQAQVLGDNNSNSSSLAGNGVSSTSLSSQTHNRSATTSNFPLSSISEKWNGSSHSRSASGGSIPAGLNVDDDSVKHYNLSASPEPPAIHEPPPAERLADGEKAMSEALEEIQADNSSDEQRMAVQAMLLYIGNILSHMDQTKYRRIMLSNTAYNSRVRRIKGAERFLLGAGFEIRGSYIEWTDEKRSASGGGAEGQKEEWREKLLQHALDRLTQYSTELTTKKTGYAASANSVASPTSASNASNRTTSTSPKPQSPANSAAPSQPTSTPQPPQQPQQQQTEPSDAHPSWLTTAPTQTPFNNPYQQPQYNPAPYQHGGNASNNFMPPNFDPALSAQYMQQAQQWMSNQSQQSNGNGNNTLQPPAQYQPSNSASAPVTPQRNASSEPAPQQHSATPQPSAPHNDHPAPPTASQPTPQIEEMSADSNTDT